MSFQLVCLPFSSSVGLRSSDCSKMHHEASLTILGVAITKR
jgi:hypothetical protein